MRRGLVLFWVVFGFVCLVVGSYEVMDWGGVLIATGGWLTLACFLLKYYCGHFNEKTNISHWSYFGSGRCSLCFKRVASISGRLPQAKPIESIIFHRVKGKTLTHLLQVTNDLGPPSFSPIACGDPEIPFTIKTEVSTTLKLNSWLKFLQDQAYIWKNYSDLSYIHGCEKYYSHYSINETTRNENSGKWYPLITHEIEIARNNVARNTLRGKGK